MLLVSWSRLRRSVFVVAVVTGMVLVWINAADAVSPVSVRGSGSAVINGETVSVRFDAVDHQIHGTSGQFVYQNRATGTRLEGTVDCVQVADPSNPIQASIGGVLTVATPDTTLVGERFLFAMRDNGNGTRSDARDEITPIAVALPCGPPPSFVPWVAFDGRITIRHP